MYGKDVQDDDIYRTAMQRFHFISMEEFMGISAEEIEKNGHPKELASKAQNVLREYLSSHDFIKLDGEQRLLLCVEQLQYMEEPLQKYM